MSDQQSPQSQVHKGERKMSKKKEGMTAYDRKFWADRVLADKMMAKANAQPLARCPFCGAEAGEDGVQVVGTNPLSAWVECDACGCEGPGPKGRRTIKTVAAKAVAAWNQRTK